MNQSSVSHFPFVHLHTCGLQDRAKLLGASTVAYLNVDIGVSGEYVLYSTLMCGLRSIGG